MLCQPRVRPVAPFAPIDPANRRQSARFAVAETEAWLGWWEGRLYRRSRATLLDISQGGGKLTAHEAPPRRSTVWVCLDGEHRTDWVEATVVEVVRLDGGLAQVRVAFREVCPYTFFEVATRGEPAYGRRPSASIGVSARR